MDQKRANMRYLPFVVLLVLGLLAIPVRIITIQAIDGETLEQLERDHYVKPVPVEAVRGNIFSSDGKLLAITSPRYEIHFDAVTVPPALFQEQVGALARGLARVLGDQSAESYKRLLLEARNTGNQYTLIHRDVDYRVLTELRDLPIFSEGQYKGGLIVHRHNDRELPFGKLAERTIGYDRVGARVGVEGWYSHDLSGQEGCRLSQKISGGAWRPLPDASEVQPVDGSDVVTTIDVRIQDIAQRALLRSLEKFEADHGTAIVMDVKTGAIRAMVNLGRTSVNTYYEERNFAVWESTEPGSTFKLATLLALLEDGVADTADIVDTEDGVYSFYNVPVRDSRRGGYGKISLGRAFEVSSNIAMARLVNESYSDHPSKFIDRLYVLGLGEKTGVDIQGETAPHIPLPGSKEWSGISLPWISHGYGIKLTPLQMLALYNAVANDGEMVQPYLMKEIQRNGETLKTHEKVVVNPAICSSTTLAKVRDVLEKVVMYGTATNIAMGDVPLAGKTGTSKLKYWEDDEDARGYQSSFMGYFPADNPQYSCAVVVSRPNPKIGYYGNVVAAPVFAEIADQIIEYQPFQQFVPRQMTMLEP